MDAMEMDNEARGMGAREITPRAVGVLMGVEVWAMDSPGEERTRVYQLEWKDKDGEARTDRVWFQRRAEKGWLAHPERGLSDEVLLAILIDRIGQRKDVAPFELKERLGRALECLLVEFAAATGPS